MNIQLPSSPALRLLSMPPVAALSVLVTAFEDTGPAVNFYTWEDATWENLIW